MAKLEKITIGGREFPCRATMGAMWRFRHETGHEVTDMDLRNMSEVAVWLWCCVASACEADGVEFGMGFLQFADRISPEVMQAWVGGQEEEHPAETETADGEKKTPS